jgi:hypothetical protein
MIASVHNLKQHNKAKPVRRIWLYFVKQRSSSSTISPLSSMKKLQFAPILCGLCSSHNG